MIARYMTSSLPPDHTGTKTDSLILKLAALEERERWLSDHFHALSQYLLGAQEEERRALSRILHDKVGQSLTAAIINLQMGQMSGGQIDPDVLTQTCETLSDCLNEVREMELNLRPSQLDDLGLAQAAEAYLQRVVRGEKQSFGFAAEGLETRFSPQLETTAFRILQDMVAICRRELVAFRLEVRMRRTEQGLKLQLDYLHMGEASPAPKIYDKNFLGIRERTAMLMGESLMLVDEGRGQVCITLPDNASEGSQPLMEG